MHLKVLKIWRLHFNAMLKISIKDKLVLRFSSACFEPHFCHVIVTSFRMVLRIICVTMDHRYVRFVVITILSIPHQWLIIVFVTRVTRRVPHVEHELLIPPEYTSSPCFLSNHKLWNIGSAEYIYTPYAGAAWMLLHINGKFTIGKLKSSLLS
jgi:hypothetical protein